MLTVAIVIPQLAIGGAESQAVMLANELARRGHRVIVVSAGGALVEDLAGRGIEHVELDLTTRRPLPLALLCRLRRVFTGSGCDIVHAHSAYTTVWSRIALVMTGIPVVTTGHGWPDRLYGRIAPLLRSASRVIAVSNDMRSKLAAAGLPSSRIVCVPNAAREPAGDWAEGRRAARHRLGVSDSEVVIALVGRMVREKGHALLLRAVGLLAEVPLRVLLVGDGPCRRSLESLAQELGLAPRVIFTGMTRDVMPLLLASDVVTLPSDSEGMPVSLLEAMAAARPVVATNVGGVGEIVEREGSGTLIGAGSVTDLASALRVLAADPLLRARMGSRGRQLYQARHTPGAMCSAVESVYACALQAGARVVSQRA